MQVAAITYLCILIITFLIQQMSASFIAVNENEWQPFYSGKCIGVLKSTRLRVSCAWMSLAVLWMKMMSPLLIRKAWVTWRYNFIVRIMMNLYNHAQNADLQNGCYAFISSIVPVVFICRAMELIPRQYNTYYILHCIIISHSTLSGYKSQRICQLAPLCCQSTLQPSCITRGVCYKRN